nr:tyrosine-type recombinase/integrase [Clostridia bacterium]
MNYNRAAAAFINYCRASGQTADTVSNNERNLRYFSEAVALPDADAEITVAHIDEYKSLLHLRGLKQSTVRAYLESLCLFFAWATERKYCAENPCTPSAVKTKVPPPAPYGHLLTREDMAALLSPVCPKGCTKKLFNRNHAIVTVLLTSGLRNSELRELRLCDLIPSENRLVVRCGKGGKMGYAPYPPVAQEAVAAWLSDPLRPSALPSDAILFGKGTDTASWQMFSRTELSTMVERFTKTVLGKASGIRTHALRHANASYLWDSGMAIDDIQSVLRHSDSKITMRYLDRLRPTAPTDHAADAFSALRAAV